MPTPNQGTSSKVITGNLETIHAIVEYLHDSALESSMKFHPRERELLGVIHSVFTTSRDEFRQGFRVIGGDDLGLNEQMNLKFFSHLNNKYIKKTQRMLDVINVELGNPGKSTCLDEGYHRRFVSDQVGFCNEQLAHLNKIGRSTGFTILRFVHALQFLGTVVTLDYMGALLDGLEKKVEGVSDSYKLLWSLFSESSIKGDRTLGKRFEALQQTLQLCSYFNLCVSVNLRRIEEGVPLEELEWVSDSLDPGDAD